ncbi:phage tail protein [Pseudomonas sp. B16120]|uniref:phage tail protein n=1 Tax=Pseudomonas sp. B16120 TaxID=3235108 RepID=UPI0037831E8B
MIDVNTQFFALLTAVGEAKQVKADAGLITWKLTHMAVGDANDTNPIPDRLQKTLINERRRAPLNSLGPDPANPGILVAEQIIPADEGGFWIRELGLFDSDGDLVAVANCAPSYKSLLSQGSGKTQVLRMNFVVKSSSNVVLLIDPSVVTATRKYVDDSVAGAINRLDFKQSVLVATTGPVVLAGVQEIDGYVPPAGSRVLVKDQLPAQARDNGLYVVGPDSWVRSVDADTSDKVTPSLLVSVERGVINADSQWQLVTDAPIVLGTTALKFQNILAGMAPLNSPVFTGAPRAETPPRFSNSKQLATAEFVMRTRGSFAGALGVSQSRLLTGDDVGMRLELAAGVLATLPPTGTVPEGSAYLISAAPFSLTSKIAVADGDQLALNNLAVPVPYTMSPGGDVILIREGNVWRGHCGSETLRSSKLFRSAFDFNTATQALPTGFTIKAGHAVTDSNGFVGITYSEAFPNACVSVVATYMGAGGAPFPLICQAGLPTRTGFNGYLTNAVSNVGSPTNGGFSWVAFGF